MSDDEDRKAAWQLYQRHADAEIAELARRASMPFSPQEEARLDAEAEAEDRKAISRWPGWGDTKFTVGVFAMIVLAGVCLITELVAGAALIGFVLVLCGASLSMPASSFLSLFVVAFVAALVLRFILKAITD